MDVTLLDVMEDYQPAPLRPADFGMTITEYTEQKGLSPEVVKGLFRKAVSEGALEKMLMRENGKPGHVMVYFRPGTWKPKGTEG